MRILFPHIGVEMPSICMVDYGRRMGINVDIEHINRPKLRRAHPDVIGIPHQQYAVRLFPITDEYRKWSPYSNRRTNGVCWHGHKNFMMNLFDEWPMATIRTALAEYNGIDQYLAKYKATRDIFFAQGQCNCSGMKLAVFERELVTGGRGWIAGAY